ncbi:uncharacterized protein PSANT_04403 [Moesziomyces antarcticus]|uniref:Zinc/iron permease n=1 Tax=Pseudozyma antarctica TaxID=84753 RepID=A0A5C3FT01_PSEA2|nr:uncharacterized protein PSANT_04403 [Moesziomyces antarcticus]
MGGPDRSTLATMLLYLLAASLVPTVLAVNGRPDDSALPEECQRRGAGNDSYTLSLHIAAIFVVFVSSSIGIVLPFVPLWLKSRPTSAANDDGDQHTHGHGHGHASGMPRTWWDEVFFIGKCFGAGVILATAFVHLTYEAFIQLSSPCLNLAYSPMAPAISMASLFAIFLVDMLLMRHIHRSRKAMDELKARRAKDKAHLESLTLLSIRPIDSPAPVDVAVPHNASALATSQAITAGKTPDDSGRVDGTKPFDATVLSERLRRNEMIEQEEKLADDKLRQRAKELDVMIIEGGIVFHSVMVGLGLGTASDAGFVPYFIAIVFHQMFDGFAIGTRMAALDFVGRRRKQAAMFLAYAFVTPVGIALGTGVRTVFEPNNPSTIIAIGVLDSISAGVLLYGALVDLLAKEFLFGPMLDASDRRLAVALASLLFGAGVMSLLGKWA